MPRVVGGRYGLSSKEFTPGMVAGVFDELARERPRRRFTIGINDDVSGTSLRYDAALDIEPPETVRAVFFGLGSDGTVGANKNTIKILGPRRACTRRATSSTTRRSPARRRCRTCASGRSRSGRPTSCSRPASSAATSSGCSTGSTCSAAAADGATLLLNCPHPAGRGVGRAVAPGPGADPRQAHRRVRDRRRPDRPRGRPRRADQHRAADLLLRHLRRAAARARRSSGSRRRSPKTYGRRGAEVVERNQAAVDRALEGLHRVEVPERATATPRARRRSCPRTRPSSSAP